MFVKKNSKLFGYQPYWWNANFRNNNSIIMITKSNFGFLHVFHHFAIEIGLIKGIITWKDFEYSKSENFVFYYYWFTGLINDCINI